MTNTLIRACITAATLTLPLIPLTACSPTPPPSPTCVGPEIPDDLEDFFDRDLAVHPASRCLSGDPDYEFVNLDRYYPIGAELGDDDGPDLVIYRERHSRRWLSSHPGPPPTYRRPYVAPAPIPTARPQSPAPASSPVPGATPSRASSVPTRASTAPSAPRVPSPSPRPVAPSPRTR